MQQGKEQAGLSAINLASDPGRPAHSFPDFFPHAILLPGGDFNERCLKIEEFIFFLSCCSLFSLPNSEVVRYQSPHLCFRSRLV